MKVKVMNHSIRDFLALDHFYLEFSHDEVRQLKEIGRGLKRCEFSKVNSGKDQWSAVYLDSNIGPCFEMLEVEKPSQLGIAFRPMDIQYIDPLELKSEMPDLSWVRGKRHWGKTKKEWFGWLSLRPKSAEKPDGEVVYTWVTAYRMLHVPMRNPTRQQASVDRFTRIKLSVGSSHLDSFRHHSQWFPGKRRFSRKSFTLEIPDRDAGVFTMDFEVIPGDQPVRLLELHTELCPSVGAKAVRTKSFETIIRGSKLVLRTREKR